MHPPPAAFTKERALRGAPCSGMTTRYPWNKSVNCLLVRTSSVQDQPPRNCLSPNFSGECAAVRLIGRLLVVELRDMDLGVRQLLFIMAVAVATVVVLMGQPL